MIRALLDTNILASGIATPQNSPGLVLTLWTAGEFELVTSMPILVELERTLEKHYFRRMVTPDVAQAVFSQIRNKGNLIPITTFVSGVATHPEDDLVLAVAVSGKADYLVTGDRQLLKLREVQGVRILTAAEFLLVLAERES